MGMVYGKISGETQRYAVILLASDYEIREYAPSVVAQVTYDPSKFKGGNKDGGFSVLAKYIGALGDPQNTEREKIAMTAPVITKCSRGGSENTATTAPAAVTMQFVLPAKFQKAEEAPKPLDERVVIREEEERKYGVLKFRGVATDEVVNDKAEKLRKSLVRDWHEVIGGELLLATRYNPRWTTLPAFRTNEVMIPLEIAPRIQANGMVISKCSGLLERIREKMGKW